MAERKEVRSTGDEQVPSEVLHDEQKEQTEEFQEQTETDSYLLIETSYGRELFQKIRTNFSHCVKPQNLLPVVHKYDHRVLVERDMQHIRCTIAREGDIAGAECLLDHVVLYKGWLPCLLKVLKDPMVLSGHVADDIEKAVDVLQEERKKQKTAVQGQAEGTYMMVEDTEAADRDTDLPERTTTFEASETPRRPLTMTRTISMTLQETWTDPTSDTYPKQMSPATDPLKTPMSRKAIDLTEDTHEKLRPEEPVIFHTASTSGVTPETTTTSEYTCDMESSADGYDGRTTKRRQLMSTSEIKRQMDVLLVGKTGNGKSSVGNSILFKEAFKSSDDMTSCTKGAQFDYSEFDGVIFKVVDGPGIGDTDLDKKDALKLVLNAMSDAISVNAEGYHAILVVVRYGGKFAEEDVRTLEIMKAIFGKGFIKDHAILVMTHGDNFVKMAKKRNDTFEQWCKRQEGVFKRLLFEVENRIVLFDNMAEDKFTRYEQLRQLVKVIDGLSCRGKRYNHEMFVKAKASRDRAIVESEQPILHESALREAALITQRFQEINFDRVEEAYECLKSLLERAQNLSERIKEQDRNTGVLSSSINFANGVKRFIEVEMESLRNITDHRQELDELTRNWQNRAEGSDITKEGEGKGKESKWKSKLQNKLMEGVKKVKEKHQELKHKKPMEIKRNEEEQNVDLEALRQRRKEKENVWSSKWKEGKQQEAVNLMEKEEETRGQMKQKEIEENPQNVLEEEGRKNEFKKMQSMFEKLGQRDRRSQTEQKYFGKTEEEDIERSRAADRKKERRITEFEEEKQLLKIQSEDQGARSMNQMAQPEAKEPEQHTRKAEEESQTATIRKTETEEVELTGNTLRRIKQIEELKSRGLDPVQSEILERLQGEHIQRAEQVEEGYRCIKEERTSVLARWGTHFRKFLSSALQWLEVKFSWAEVE